MRTKITVTNTRIADAAELESVAGNIARAIVARASITDTMNARIVALRKDLEAHLTTLTKRIDDETDRVHEYVRQHPSVIPAYRKSADLLHAVIGYRTGTPKVAAMKGWTLKTALEACLRYRPKWVRQTASLDKDQIIADVPVGGQIESVGLTVVQDETFFVAPKLEEPGNVVTTERPA